MGDITTYIWEIYFESKDDMILFQLQWRGYSNETFRGI